VNDQLSKEDKAKVRFAVQTRRMDGAAELSESVSRGLRNLADMAASNYTRAAVRSEVNHWLTLGGADAAAATIFDEIVRELGVDL
jgi:hypothetical protein